MARRTLRAVLSNEGLCRTGFIYPCGKAREPRWPRRKAVQRGRRNRAI